MKGKTHLRHDYNGVLKESNLELNKVDHIVFFEKPFLKFERLLETYMAFAPTPSKVKITASSKGEGKNALAA